jgi:hypothetical protein
VPIELDLRTAFGTFTPATFFGSASLSDPFFFAFPFDFAMAASPDRSSLPDNRHGRERVPPVRRGTIRAIPDRRKPS